MYPLSPVWPSARNSKENIMTPTENNNPNFRLKTKLASPNPKNTKPMIPKERKSTRSMPNIFLKYTLTNDEMFLKKSDSGLVPKEVGCNKLVSSRDNCAETRNCSFNLPEKVHWPVYLCKNKIYGTTSKEKTIIGTMIARTFSSKDKRRLFMNHMNSTTGITEKRYSGLVRYAAPRRKPMTK